MFMNEREKTSLRTSHSSLQSPSHHACKSSRATYLPVPVVGDVDIAGILWAFVRLEIQDPFSTVIFISPFSLHIEEQPEASYTTVQAWRQQQRHLVHLLPLGY
jgi:hypothetical protein